MSLLCQNVMDEQEMIRAMTEMPDEDLSEHRLKQEILVSPFKISLIFVDCDGKFAISQQK